jgi:coproporphyrinogen III oxidase
MNIRYFEAGEVRWFGGGIDLTPYYPLENQVVGFHQALQGLCVAHGRDYQGFKQACDAYFFLKHRGEARGIGGLFFDHLQLDKQKDLSFAEALGLGFPDLFKLFLMNQAEPRSSGISSSTGEPVMWNSICSTIGARSLACNREVVRNPF